MVKIKFNYKGILFSPSTIPHHSPSMVNEHSENKVRPKRRRKKQASTTLFKLKFNTKMAQFCETVFNCSIFHDHAFQRGIMQIETSELINLHFPSLPLPERKEMHCKK